MEEIWKDVKDFEGLYQVSNLGRVRSLDRYVKCCNGIRLAPARILKPSITFGYYFVILSKNSIPKSYRVNRLVAQAFIPNPDNLPEVDHINRDRIDNRVENLRWADKKMQANNRKERILINRKDVSKPILQYTKDMVFIVEHPSIKEAERKTGIHNTTISRCCRGERKTAGGYIWKFKN